MRVKVLYDWEWVANQIETIGDKVGDKYQKIDYVTGIPRGGVIPAVMFSHKYDISYIELEEAKRFPREYRQKIILFDDICDTGKTLKDIHLNHFITATLAYKTTAKYIPDFFSEVIKDDRWIVFPWENIKAKIIQEYLVK